MKLSVLGAGSWGITLARHLQGAGHEVSLWEFDPARAQKLSTLREDPVILPGVQLPPAIPVVSDMAAALSGKEGVVFVVPSHVMRSTAKTAAPAWPKGAWAVSATKGLEEESLLRMSEVLAQALPAGVPLSVFSGPSHAEEVSRGIPTTIVAAAKDQDLAKKVQEAFHGESLRVYTSGDMVGVELGGSLKNVIAVAAGILDGLGLGDNTKAALMTRGLHEITRLGVALGADPKTFAGLAGMGDLFVTCMSRHSRNRLLGEKIGKGATLKDALGQMVMVAEGVRTAQAAWDLAQRAKVDTPIIQQVRQVLFEDKTAKDAMRDLLTRAPKSEYED